MKHQGGERDVSANRDAVLVCYLFALDDVHVFVDGQAIRTCLTHDFQLLGRVTANKEGGNRALLADMRKYSGEGIMA